MFFTEFITQKRTCTVLYNQRYLKDIFFCKLGYHLHGLKSTSFLKDGISPEKLPYHLWGWSDTFYDPAFSSCKCLFLRPHTVLYILQLPGLGQAMFRKCYNQHRGGHALFFRHAITIHINCVIFLEPLFPIADFFSLLAPLLYLNDDK